MFANKANRELVWGARNQAAGQVHRLRLSPVRPAVLPENQSSMRVVSSQLSYGSQPNAAEPWSRRHCLSMWHCPTSRSKTETRPSSLALRSMAGLPGAHTTCDMGSSYLQIWARLSQN